MIIAHGGRPVAQVSCGSSTPRRTTSRTRSANSRACSRAIPVVAIGACTVTATSSGQTISRPLAITKRLRATLTGSTGRPESIASRKMPSLETADRAVGAPRPLGKDNQRARAARRVQPSS